MPSAIEYPPESESAPFRRFQRAGSEAAFREVVAQWLPLVWSTARRVVGGDAALAKDVSQTVFADLAQKARSLPDSIPVGGWLHRHTFFTASKAVRSEVRRKDREQAA